MPSFAESVLNVCLNGHAALEVAAAAAVGRALARRPALPGTRVGRWPFGIAERRQRWEVHLRRVRWVGWRLTAVAVAVAFERYPLLIPRLHGGAATGRHAGPGTKQRPQGYRWGNGRARQQGRPEALFQAPAGPCAPRRRSASGIRPPSAPLCLAGAHSPPPKRPTGGGSSPDARMWMHPERLQLIHTTAHQKSGFRLVENRGLSLRRHRAVCMVGCQSHLKVLK